jgi:hypothetical protein
MQKSAIKGYTKHRFRTNHEQLQTSAFSLPPNMPRGPSFPLRHLSGLESLMYHLHVSRLFRAFRSIRVIQAVPEIEQTLCKKAGCLRSVHHVKTTHP